MNEIERLEQVKGMLNIKAYAEQPYIEAIDVGINALEKQMPKEPLQQQTNPKDMLIGLCPECKNWWMNKYERFCPNCGQALKWGD